MILCVAYYHDLHVTLTFNLGSNYWFFGIQSCPMQNLFVFWHRPTIWHVDVSTWDDVSHAIMTSMWPWPLTSGTYYWFFWVTVVSGAELLCFDIGIWYWMYHRETMCHVSSWHTCDLDLWPQDHTIDFWGTVVSFYLLKFNLGLWYMTYMWPWPLTSGLNYGFFWWEVQLCLLLSFNVGSWYLSCRCITMRRCVPFHHDLHATLTYDLTIKLLISGDVQWCVRCRTFLCFDIGLWYLACGCITIRRCVFYHHDLHVTLTFDLRITLFIFGGTDVSSFIF